MNLDDIVFPDIPDEPRRVSSTSAPRRESPFKVEVIPQPKPINYGCNTTRQRWMGFVTDYSDIVRFGIRTPGPREVKLTCLAVSYDHAHMLLHKMAKDQGYALGGVKGIQLAE